MKSLFKRLLAKFNLAVQKNSSYNLYEQAFHDWQELRNISNDSLSQFIKFRSHSKSQIGQDLFVLLELDFKKDGFFVEFGATNGINLSNTYLLEKEFNWTGILAEPAKVWHEALKNNRSADIETNCVWTESGKKLLFNEVSDPELSTISNFSDSDIHSTSRKENTAYEVTTISLNDLLQKYNAPREIDYLSIDTEGSEFDILNSFDFSNYDIRIISCEHNKTKSREKIYNLLTSKGYKRKFSGLSEFDDWYIKVN